jgi:hypothetical protein
VTAYPARFLGAITHPLLIVDNDTSVLWTNDAFLAVFRNIEEPVGVASRRWTKSNSQTRGLQDLLRRALSVRDEFSRLQDDVSPR